MSKEKSRRIATRPEQGSRESSSVRTAGSSGGEPRVEGTSDGVPRIDSSTSSTAAALLFAKAAQQELVLLMRLIAEGDSATAMRIAWCIVERGRAVLGPELPPSASLPTPVEALRKLKKRASRHRRVQALQAAHSRVANSTCFG